MWALITEWGLSLGALGCLAGAGAAAIYLPLVGRYVAAGLVALAAGLGSYDLGYAARGRLDQSTEIAAQLDAAREQIEGNKIVQEDAAARARDSEQQANQLQEKISAYEAALNAKPESPAAPAAPGCPTVAPACALDARDVRALDGLRLGSGSGRKAGAAGRAR